VNVVFADTSFFLALLRKDDELHSRAIEQWKFGHRVLTTEFILLELGNACARAADHADFLALVAGARSNPRIRILPLDSHYLNRGLERMSLRPDKDWSLTDCISFVVMEDEGIREALTGDKDFGQAGFAALLRSS
jgi:predicted nucleic acid-binding protein